MEQITPVEMLMIRYIGKGIKADMDFPKYWEYQYNVDAKEVVASLLDKGFLIVGGVDYSLQFEDIKKLKDILTRAGLKVSGKKADLIDRILANIDKHELLKLHLPEYIILSKKGDKLLIDNDPVEMKTNYESEMMYGDDKMVHLTLDLIGKKNFEEAEANIENLKKYDKKVFSAFMDFHINALDKYAPYEKEIKTCILYAHMVGKSSIANFLMSEVYNIEIPNIKFERAKKYLLAMKDYLFFKESKIGMIYTVKTASDERCCEHCKQLEGHIFEPDDAKLGITFPPFDKCACDYCRCYASISIR